MHGLDQSSKPKLIGLKEIRSPAFTQHLKHPHKLAGCITIAPQYFNYAIAMIIAVSVVWPKFHHDATQLVIMDAPNQCANCHVERNQVVRKANINVPTIIPNVINSPFVSILII